MDEKKDVEDALARFEPARRASLRRLAVGAGTFVAPVVATFALDGLGGTARAQVSNMPPANPVPASTPAGLALAAGAVAGAAAVALRKRGRGK